MLKNRFLGGKCDSGGDAGGGGEGIKSAVAGVHMSPGDQAGATFGNAGVGGLPGGMRRSAACAFSIAGDIRSADHPGATFGSVDVGVGGLPAAAGMRRSPACAGKAIDHSCGGEELGAGVGGVLKSINDDGGIHSRSPRGEARGPGSHTSLITGIAKPTHTRLYY